jgi:hypothetical protein
MLDLIYLGVILFLFAISIFALNLFTLGQGKQAKGDE